MTILTRERIIQTLLRIIKIGVFLILFLPLVMNSHFFFPFIVVKNVLFRIAVEIIFVIYLILAYLEPKYRPRFNKITIALLVFFTISIISSLAGIGLYRSFWGNYERMGGLFHLLHIILYFFVLINTFKEKKDWHSFFTFSIFSSVIMGFIALAQWLGVPFLLKSSGGSRLSGTVGNATFFAAYLMFNLFFLLYFWAREKRFDLKLFALSFLIFDIYLILGGLFYKFFITSNWGFFNFFKVAILNETLSYPKLFYPFLIFQILIFTAWFLRTRKHTIRILLSVIFLFEFFIFFNTQTRGALLGFGLGILVLLGSFLIFSQKRKIKIICFISIASLILLGVLIYLGRALPFIEKNSTLHRLTTISLTDVTTQSRLLTWNTSWQGWKETPKSFLIGYGLENYYYAFNKYFPEKIYLDPGSRIWFDRAHNIIFDVGVTTGIVGLITYLSILAFAIIALFKKYRSTKVASSSLLLISLLVAYFFQNFFVFDTLNTEIPFYLFLAFIVFLTTLPPVPQETTEELPKKDINIIYIVVLVIILFGMFALNVKTLRANNYIYKAMVLAETENQKFEYFKKAINEAVTGKFETRQQLSNYVNGLARDKNASFDQTKVMVDYTVEELKKSIDEEPLSIRHYLWLSTFYNATVRFNRTNPQKILDLLGKDVVELSPSRSHIYYEIAQAYTFMNNFNKAEEYFRKGIAITPWVIEDHWTLLSIYIVFEKHDLAEAKFKFMAEELGWKPSLKDSRRLVDLYGRVKNYPKMIEYQEKVVTLKPSAKDYAALAALYAKVGENQKAKEATQKAVEIDPNFAAEAVIFFELLDKGELLER